MANKKQTDFTKSLNKNLDIQKQLNEGLENYVKMISEIGKNQEKINILKNQEQEAILEIKKVNAELAAARVLSDKAEIRRLKIKLDLQNDKLDGILKESISLEDINEELIKAVKSGNKLTATFNSSLKALKAMPALLKNGFGKLKGTGIFDIDKELRNAATSINVIGDNFKGFSNNINKANKTTGIWGIGTKDLAKAQQSYSEEIGRSMVLNEEGLTAIGEMAAGTTLGAEGAASMLGEMDKFNISATKTKDIIEETVQSAAKMGVNSTKAIKMLQTQLKLSQKFHFKGGVKGLTTMANEAARLKLDMEGMAGLADKVFRVEGAVEMAAKLAVMGGEFAKLGDFNTLMFKARNDFGGFTKDIAKATVEFVEFNKETGETQIKGGLAADRMREIASITGIQIEKLQEMASMQKRIQEFGGMIPSIIYEEEDRELIASLATMDKNGEAIIRIENKDFKLKDLEQNDIERYRNDKKTLAERAKQAQTFDDTINNFGDLMKTMLLPFVQSITKGFGDPIQELLKTWASEGMYDKIEEFGKDTAEFVSTVGKYIVKIGTWLGPGGTLAAIFGPKILFNLAKWFGNGVELSRGFMMGTKGFKGTSSSGTPSTAFTKGKSGAWGGAKLGAATGVMIGIGAGYQEWQENEATGMDSDENMKRTALVGGGGILGGIGAGAATGALVGGPAAPITALIGGIIGGALGVYAGDKAGDALYGEVNDGIIKFNENDKFINVDKNTMVAGTDKGGNKKLAETISGGSGNVKHQFEDLNISINLNSDSSWLNSIGEDIVNDRTFVRSLTTKIQEEIRMAIGGGKLNPNPI